MNTVLAIIQFLCGSAIVFGVLPILIYSMDKNTPERIRLAFLSMIGFGTWFAIEPLVYWAPTSSTPGLFFSLALCYALLRYGRQVRGVIEGDPWLVGQK